MGSNYWALPAAFALLALFVAWVRFLCRWERSELRKADADVARAVTQARRPLPRLRPLTPAEEALLADADWDHVWAVIGEAGDA